MRILTLAISLMLTATALAAPTVSELAKAPPQAIVGAATVKLDKAYVWRDFQETEAKNLVARVGVENLPDGARITAIYLVQKDQLWASTRPEVKFGDKIQIAVVRGGPAWAVDSKVDVIVEVSRIGKTYRLRLPNQPITRVE